MLVVDDHDAARVGMVELLGESAANLRLDAVSSAQEALTCCVALAPDVVLLDYRLPGRDARDTIAALRRLMPDGAVIVLTGDQNPSVRAAVRAAGAHGCVSKAGDIGELIAAIEGAAGRTA